MPFDSPIVPKNNVFILRFLFLGFFDERSGFEMILFKTSIRWILKLDVK